MKLRLFASVLSLILMSAAVSAQQPRGAREALGNMTSTPGSHASFTFDKDMLQFAEGFIDDRPAGQRAVAALNSVTVETFRYQQPAFYIPESMAELVASYNRAGWKHLVDQNAATVRDSTMPHKPMTDLWLHFRGSQIDDVTVLVRGPLSMNLIQVSGLLRPLDLIHLSGHFGIPKVDPDAVMVPAPPGR